LGAWSKGFVNRRSAVILGTGGFLLGGALYGVSAFAISQIEKPTQSSSGYSTYSNIAKKGFFDWDLNLIRKWFIDTFNIIS
jgi:hypothetical protein